MPLAWLLLGCGPSMDVQRSGVIACPDPDRRGSVAFELKLENQTRTEDAVLHGGGLLVEDLDDDGWMDLLIPGESEHVLRWGINGNADRLFEVADDDLAALPVDMAVGATAVDYDGDADLDVYVTRWMRPNTLLRNDGGRVFTDVSAQAFPGAAGARSQSASWGDIDGDGDLDLFVGTYGVGTTIDVLDPAPDCSDHLPDDAQLWRNEGDGTFVDITDTLPEAAHGYTFMSGFYDLHGDGHPELFLAHDDGGCGPSVVLDNDGGTFTVDEEAGFSRGAHDMGMGVGDLNGDALPDFLFTSWNAVSLLQSSEERGSVRWIDYADARGLRVDAPPADRPGQAEPGQQVFGWGAELGDLDNDADLDAVMVFGYWSYYDNRSADPPRQADGLWLQGSDGSFTDVASTYGLDDDSVSRGVVLADVDNNGYLDVLKHTLNGGIPLHLARCGDQAWVRIRLEAPPPNTRAVGARIRVTAGDQVHTRWITSGSTGMYSGAPLEAHVGLGSAATIDRIEVTWPDGHVSTTRSLRSRQLITLRRRTSR